MNEDQRRIKKLIENGAHWSSAYKTEKGVYRRCYYSGRRKYAKKMTNSKTRKWKFEDTPKNPGGYRKMFDYWWTIF